MGRETIGIDVDEVLYPFLSGFINHHNGQYGTDHKFHEFKSYHFEQALGIEVPEVVRRVYEYTELDDLHIEPIEESQAAIRSLAQKFDLAIITSRHEKYKERTLRYLTHYYGPAFAGLHTVGYEKIMKNPVTKASVCRAIGARAMIDDTLGHVVECAAQGIEGVLFGDYPWNSGEVPAGIVRCLSWPQVLKHFNVES
ncbi:MAG: hypothetical protein JWS12_990 [Candidatus Saccharibacteria bacterium]|nr:hypothetical protein [Candidatus Saccharibacteria bacterium]